MTESDLLKLKSEIDRAKVTVAELTGQQTMLTKQLHDDWQCKTIAEAEVKLKEMEANIASIDKKIERGVQDLETKYNV
jgi:hypothetical protein